MENNISKVLNCISQAIFDKKGMNILVLDVRNLSTMADYYVIAEGTVDRHVKALSQSILEALQPLGWKPWHIEGEKTGDWTVLDFSDVVVHLFIPELREKYALEKCWAEGKIVDVEINLNKKLLGG
jgi:ribosome-associated protein